MPAERQPAQKRRRLPFNPPRPRASATAEPSSTTAAAKKPNGKAPRKTGTAKTARTSTTSRKRSPPPDSPTSGSASQSGSEPDSDSASRSREQSLSEEPDYILAEVITANQSDDVTSSEPTIPSKLLTRLLHHHFQSGKTKINKDANEVVAKYVDIFVREALARAAYERAENAGSGSVGDGFLEVEDLEKMAPQLALDF